jgi:hypothetical protein
MTRPSTSCLLMRVAMSETARLKRPSTMPMAWMRDFLEPVMETLGRILMLGFLALRREM